MFGTRLKALLTTGAVMLSSVSLAAAQQAPAASFAGPPASYDNSSYQAWVNGNVNVRVGGGTRFQRFDTLRRGEYIFVSGCDRSWCYVEYERGVGYVSKRFIGTGENPYNTVSPFGPAGPGIPPQEPGTVYDPPLVRID